MPEEHLGRACRSPDPHPDAAPTRWMIPAEWMYCEGERGTRWEGQVLTPAPRPVPAHAAPTLSPRSNW